MQLNGTKTGAELDNSNLDEPAIMIIINKSS